MKRRTVVLALLVAVLALAASSVASADSIIDQYTEGVPSAGGSGSSGGSGGSGGSGSFFYDSSAVSASTASVLKSQGVTGKQLKNVASSSRYGAPQSKVGDVASTFGNRNPLSAAVSAVSGGGDAQSHFVGLLIALAVIAASAILSAGYRRRTSS